MNSSYWTNSLKGVEALFDLTNLALGFTLVFLARILGAQYFIRLTDHKGIIERAQKQILINSGLFLVFFLYFAISLILSSGYTYDANGIVFIEKFKYLHNLIQMPIVGILFLIGVVLVLLGLFISIINKKSVAIFFTGIGTVLTVFSVFLISGLNNTSFYPSITDTQSSLTIVNASSSLFTLKTMTYVSILVPFVLAYIVYVWRLMDSKKINADEINNTPESY